MYVPCCLSRTVSGLSGEKSNMKATQKVQTLRKRIDDALRPLITSDYHLLEVPYYSNVGDTLIWQGELDFLKTIPYQCKSMHSLETFRYKNISEKDIILFQGGGNFGDIWVRNHEFKMSVVKAYPNNRIIFFPQSVWFCDKKKLESCANDLRVLPNVTICARDYRSYALLSEYFCDEILLVPDMAFYMDVSREGEVRDDGPEVVLLRKDVEYRPVSALDELLARPDVMVSDWPVMENGGVHGLMLNILKRFAGNFPFFVDKYAEIFYKKRIMSSGIEFLRNAHHIYTTRLHGAILSLILGKDVTVFDNSYGKNSDFFYTWLSDCEMITMAG